MIVTRGPLRPRDWVDVVRGGTELEAVNTLLASKSLTCLTSNANVRMRNEDNKTAKVRREEVCILYNNKCCGGDKRGRD